MFSDLSKDYGGCFIFITKSWSASSVPVFGNHAENCELGGSQTGVFCVKQSFSFKMREEQKICKGQKSAHATVVKSCLDI